MTLTVAVAALFAARRPTCRTLAWQAIGRVANLYKERGWELGVRSIAKDVFDLEMYQVADVNLVDDNEHDY